MILCNRIRQVNIEEALTLLPEVHFVDTRGTNGWIARPSWVQDFVSGLHLGGKAVRALLRLLPAGQGIPLHIDEPMFGNKSERRFHVPLVTHPDVVMRWPDDNVEVHLEAGWLYEVDYSRRHEIVHRASIGRVHLQVNVVGAEV